MKLEELTEARRPTPMGARRAASTTFAEPSTIDPDMLRQREFFAPAAAGQDKPLAQQQAQASRLSQAVAQADMSRAPAINTAALPAWAMDDDDDVDNDYADPEPQTPGTDLAVQSKDAVAQGWQNPDWMTIKQLPGYMQQGIRALGKTVFGSLTSTPLSKVSILANLQGGGPSEERELNAVAHHARATAQEPRDLSMQFGEVIPGYEPDATLYVGEEDTYLIVQDEMGKYIYHWPSSDTKGMDGGQREERPSRPGLRGGGQRRIR